MVEHNPPASADSARAPVISLPVALYVSGKLIFDLYDGGLPCRRFLIRWERLVPTKKSEPVGRPTGSANRLALTARLVPVFHAPPNADSHLIANG
jgi:hypothetical protein